ncbi:hypothetical protein AJ85_20235 [Alkalihalobacillus alcalophilus ATCC 27647 = CGMCC 1.3604]|uniref:Transporter n=1 Tax=Alkalihalobacillus alcalophilus ATCC 27647 = CGMCC 1.3604 TaxID=1218173 RepID=J8TGC4_ALKAL|nr:AEC family transporter [Alkalihalobacillus alcalophilus]AFV25918.1 transporter [Alkalihalobacillus alcalophilus ATCC 27647 = CGMCC 1.3604]KGA98587.1 hypothetical protein BALCAV_0203625 [Alkalihalobacillus alcalophilus ATCC 27647 = CGMCC 1.3604]MED1560429.1 hypothetical protein [Alkalihalobacillus alcalophilus]THG88974.1 hypothetical protein AJ85_20235 [Alkalihalobacillus alcalophilus ATCC 27647 = CGMCC 1.3604]
MFITFLLAIGIIVGGLIGGRLLRFLIETQKLPAHIPLDKLIKNMIPFVILGLNPLILIGAFWIVEIQEMEFLFLPVIGIFTLLLGGVFALIAARIYQHNNKQAGAMFVSGSFSNLGSFGMLFCFLFLGEMGLAIAAMFRLFEELFYYTVCFPVAKRYGEAEEKQAKKSKIKQLIKDPFIMVTLIAVCLGVGLNFSTIERPEFFGTLNEFLVPLATFLLVVPLGFSMRVKSVRTYLKEGFTLAFIKSALVPVVVVGVAYLLGLGSYQDGLLLKVILILAAMPPAVMALVPAQLYKLEIELANANWIVSTSMLVVVLPILYFLIQ